jgi:transcriptional repressor NrdR
MKCPFCGFADTKVIDSRLGREGNNIRRRRECVDCGRREPFDRLKIISGMQRACEKRPVSIATVEKLVDRLEVTLQESGEKEIEASRIGKAVMEALHDIDEVAYVRFASVYRQFKDINEFMSELKEILAKGEGRGQP